jgi:predicted transposase YbfD/YdcC
LHAFSIEPLQADFPFARALVVVRSERTIKKTGRTTHETRYYLSSESPDRYSPDQWQRLIRGHWGGVEIRNHWRRDAIWGEDHSRSRNPNLLANLALIRSVLLRVLAQHCPDCPLPEILEQLHSRPGRCLALLRNS